MNNDRLPAGERMSMMSTAAVLKKQPNECNGCPHAGADLCCNTEITAQQTALNCRQKIAIKSLIKGHFVNG